MRRLVVLLVLCLPACVPSNLAPGKSPEQAASVNTQLAIEYMRLGKLASAREFIDRALGQDPKSPSVQVTAGLVYERMGETVKAEHAYTAAMHLAKGDPNILNSYAGFLCRSGRASEGEKLFLSVVRNPLYQTPEVALVNAGVCVRGAGDNADAEHYFQQALSMRPNLAEALLQMGILALDRGDAAQAVEMVQRFLGVNPPTPEILWLGVRAERKLGDAMAAAGYARRIESEFPNSEQAQMMRAGVTR